MQTGVAIVSVMEDEMSLEEDDLSVQGNVSLPVSAPEAVVKAGAGQVVAVPEAVG